MIMATQAGAEGSMGNESSALGSAYLAPSLVRIGRVVDLTMNGLASTNTEMVVGNPANMDCSANAARSCF
jgi:hypothetical protein